MICVQRGWTVDYYQIIWKPLTPEEEVYYLTKFKLENDESAKEVLIERNMRLVAHIAKNITTQQKIKMTSFL